MSERQGHFVQVLNRREVLALAFGAMIGWGWVVLAGSWIQSAGAVGAIVAFAIGGFAIILIGLTYSELASAMPLTGGEHVYSYRALGVTGSFVCTWAIIMGYVSLVAFETVAFPHVLEYLIPGYRMGHLWTVAGYEVHFTWLLVGLLGAVGMTIINILGIKTAALLQKVVTVIIAVIGIMLITGALFAGDSANMEPLFTDATGIMAVLIMVPFLFVGFDVIPQAAEEVKLPPRAIGKVIIFSVCLAVVWYIGIALAVSLALSDQAITQEMTEGQGLVTAQAMTAVFGGGWAGKLLVLAGLAGIVTSWNAFFIGGSRAIYAMAHTHMLPGFLGKLHPKYNTPYNAILLIGALSCFAPFFGRQTLVWLVDASGLGIVVAYALVAVSFLVLRKREPQMSRPFKVANGELVGYGALILSIGLGILYLPGISPAALIWPQEWLIVLIGVGLGVVFYYWARLTYGKEAPAHLIDNELSTGHSDLPEEPTSSS